MPGPISLKKHDIETNRGPRCPKGTGTKWRAKAICGKLQKGPDLHHVLFSLVFPSTIMVIWWFEFGLLFFFPYFCLGVPLSNNNFRRPVDLNKIQSTGPQIISWFHLLG